MAGIQKGSSDNLTSPIPHLLNADFVSAVARLAAGLVHYAGRDYYQRDTDSHYRLKALSKCFAADGTTPATMPGTWGTLEAHWVAGGSAGMPGTPGTNGNRVLALSAAPVLSDGNLSDLAIVSSIGDLYEKTASGWALRGNLKGPAGTGGTGTPQATNLNMGVVRGGGLGNVTVNADGSQTAPVTPFYLMTGTANDGYMTQAATSAELALRAPIVSPVLSGNPQTVTPGYDDSSTSIASTFFINRVLMGDSSKFGAVLVNGSVQYSGFTDIRAPNTYIINAAVAGTILLARPHTSDQGFFSSGTTVNLQNNRFEARAYGSHCYGGVKLIRNLCHVGDIVLRANNSQATPVLVQGGSIVGKIRGDVDAPNGFCILDNVKVYPANAGDKGAIGTITIILRNGSEFIGCPPDSTVTVITEAALTGPVPATATTLGVVKIGSGLSVDGTGLLIAPPQIPSYLPYVAFGTDFFINTNYSGYLFGSESTTAVQCRISADTTAAPFVFPLNAYVQVQKTAAGNVTIVGVVDGANPAPSLTVAPGSSLVLTQVNERRTLYKTGPNSWLVLGAAAAAGGVGAATGGLFRGVWTANTAYGQYDSVIVPAGNVGPMVYANAAFTSGASFLATNWTPEPGQSTNDYTAASVARLGLGVALLTTATNVSAAINEVRNTLPATTEQAAAYTLALTDAGNVVPVNNATAVAVTIPPNSAVAWPPNTVINLSQAGAGQILITAGAGVTIRQADSQFKSAKQWAEISLRRRGLDEWVLTGYTAS